MSIITRRAVRQNPESIKDPAIEAPARYTRPINRGCFSCFWNILQKVKDFVNNQMDFDYTDVDYNDSSSDDEPVLPALEQTIVNQVFNVTSRASIGEISREPAEDSDLIAAAYAVRLIALERAIEQAKNAQAVDLGPYYYQELMKRVGEIDALIDKDIIKKDMNLKEIIPETVKTYFLNIFHAQISKEAFKRYKKSGDRPGEFSDIKRTVSDEFFKEYCSDIIEKSFQHAQEKVAYLVKEKIIDKKYENNPVLLFLAFNIYFRFDFEIPTIFGVYNRSIIPFYRASFLRTLIESSTVFLIFFSSL